MLKGAQSIGLTWWMLAREVLLIKGKMTRETGFVLEGKAIMPDLYFYRDAEDQDKEEAAEIRDGKEAWPPQQAVDAKLDDVGSFCFTSILDSSRNAHLTSQLLFLLYRIRETEFFS